MYILKSRKIQINNKSTNKKALVIKAFSSIFLCPLHGFVRTFHIENKQKC